MTDVIQADQSDTYGTVSKTFHWLTALLIFAAIPLGLIAERWPYDTDAQLATKALLFSAHKTIGVTIFFVALARILWALSQPRPEPLHPDRRIETLAAATTHWLLYAALVIVPLSGWLHHAATTGFAPLWLPFGDALPFVPKSEVVADFFGAWHWVFTRVLIAAVLLHVAGALKHALWDRDRTLQRMWFGESHASGDGGHGGLLPPLAAAAIWAAAIGLGTVWGLPEGTAPATALPAEEAEPATQATAEANSWQVQEGTLNITVRQLGNEITGSFADWTADIVFDADADGAEKGDVRVEVAIPSLKLGSVTDNALGADYFNAEDYPTAVFEAPIRAAAEGDGYVADGTLRLKGNEQSVTLPFTLEIDGDSATMQGETTLDRRNYDIGGETEQNVGHPVGVSVELTATKAEGA